jgi:hypothetical protein
LGNLQRKVDCIDKAIKLTEEEKKRLYEGWKTELDKVKKATEPADCAKIPDVTSCATKKSLSCGNRGTRRKTASRGMTKVRRPGRVL